MTATAQKTRSAPAIPLQPLCNLTDAVAVKSVLVGPRSLRENGIHRFVENATVVCVCFQIGELLFAWFPHAPQAPDLDIMRTYAGPEVPPEIQKAVTNGARFITHNCELERAVFRKLGIPDTPTSLWFNTSAMARAWMLPEELQRLATALDLPVFAPAESTIAPGPLDESTMRRMAMSGISEVVVVGAIAVRLHCLLPDLSPAQIEKKFHDKHLEINERGIQIDLELVTAAARIAEMELVVTDRKIQKITAGTVALSTLRNSNPDSASSLLAVLKRRYQFELPSCDEDAIFGVLEQLHVNLSDSRAERRRKRTIKAILYARLRVASTGIGKLDSILNQTSADGRLRGQYKYYGCHTGRSSSRGVQLQNLSRPKEGVDVSGSRLAVQAYGLAIRNNHRQAADESLQTLRLAAGSRGIPAAIAASVATTLVAAEGHMLILADACQIEPRLLFWLANDHANLKLYRDFDAGIGKDPYCAAAEKLRGGAGCREKGKPYG